MEVIQSHTTKSLANIDNTSLPDGNMAEMTQHDKPAKIIHYSYHTLPEVVARDHFNDSSSKRRENWRPGCV
jgi:hypothetical protein